MWYTVNNETGDKIESFMTLKDAVNAIHMYVRESRIDGTYTECFFYDVYNDTYDLYAHGDWKHVYELAILCADNCTKEEAEIHLNDGAMIYDDTAFGLSKFVYRYVDNVMPECFDEIISAWKCLSSVIFEDHCYKIDYLLNKIGYIL